MRWPPAQSEVAVVDIDCRFVEPRRDVSKLPRAIFATIATANPISSELEIIDSSGWKASVRTRDLGARSGLGTCARLRKIEPVRWRASLASCTVMVHQHQDSQHDSRAAAAGTLQRAFDA